MPRLWRLMPVFGSTSHEPNPAAFDWISDTPIPCVVGGAQVRGVAGGGRATDGGSARCGSIRLDRGVDRGQQRDAVGPFVQDVGTVVPGGRGRLDQQVRPLRVVGIVGEADRARPAARAASVR